ncbi:MAG: hypothetical protein EOO53_19245 [Gammaproteobacteria bacterium]|nr:MAG: hypothetical protein EOO53_19245 [Gammaproteobacteria bacterium]
MLHTEKFFSRYVIDYASNCFRVLRLHIVKLNSEQIISSQHFVKMKTFFNRFSY